MPHSRPELPHGTRTRKRGHIIMPSTRARKAGGRAVPNFVPHLFQNAAKCIATAGMSTARENASNHADLNHTAQLVTTRHGLSLEPFRATVRQRVCGVFMSVSCCLCQHRIDRAGIAGFKQVKLLLDNGPLGIDTGKSVPRILCWPGLVWQ